MKNIITQLRANNQVTVRYIDRPNCYAPKNQGDLSGQVESTRIAYMQRETERIYAKIRGASTEYVHDNSGNFDVCADKKLHYSGAGKIGEIFSMSRYKGNACTIPDIVRYKRIVEGRVELVEQTPHELDLRRKATLDIIKKSQQRPRKPRPWGLPQTVKKFTRNAKQKILEAGAVVDRHTTPDSRFMITLTVPGSGIDVYDAVARYSGYMVNRLTQIIRRWEAKGVRVYWFFVWEHQKRGALHMHWCLTVDNSPAMSRILCKQIRAKWFDLLEELSVKTGIDLFRKRGLSGTWRHTPEVWQADIQLIEKSVAAYFSKYLSKNCETSKYNRDRRDRQETLRKKYPDRVEYARVISLCPSRYWGCGSRVKQLCKRYRVDVCFAVASRQEGDYVASFISKWLAEISDKLTEVRRSFKKVAPDTGYEYCKGWESKTWFDPDVMPEVLRLFRRLRKNQARKVDAIGALLDLDSF